MTGDVNFSGKISKKIDLKEINVEKLDNSKKEKLDSIFNVNQKASGKDALTVDELINAVNKIDKNIDGKLSDAEINESWNKLDNAKKQGIEKTEYIAYIKSMAEKNSELAKNDNIGNSYTVQLGEQFDDLVERVLKSNNIEKPTSEQIEACKKQIIEVNKNNGSIKFKSDGSVRWLVAGAKIILPVDTTSETAKSYIQDKDNKAEVEEKYLKWKKGEIKSFKYTADDKGSYEVRGGNKTDIAASEEVNKTVEKDKKSQVSQTKKVKPSVADSQKEVQSKSAQNVNKKVSKDINTQIADTIYDIADTKSGEVSVRGMKKVIEKNINKNNVVDVWNSYQKRHKDDYSMIDTMTSEWLSPGARADVLDSAKHIISSMLDRAKELGLTQYGAYSALNSKLEALEQRGKNWVEGKTFTTGLNGKKQAFQYDYDLASFVQKDINNLAKLISDKTNKEVKSKSAKNADNKEPKDVNAKIADSIYGVADTMSGEESAKKMNSIIEKNINKDNVADVWKKYQQEYKDDYSMIDTMTSEWLNTKARVAVLKSTKHIITSMLDKAKDLGLTHYGAYTALNSKLDTINKRGESWVKAESFTTGLNGKKQAFQYDYDLASFVQKDISNLAKLISENENKKAK